MVSVIVRFKTLKVTGKIFAPSCIFCHKETYISHIMVIISNKNEKVKFAGLTFSVLITSLSRGWIFTVIERANPSREASTLCSLFKKEDFLVDKLVLSTFRGQQIEGVQTAVMVWKTIEVSTNMDFSHGTTVSFLENPASAL